MIKEIDKKAFKEVFVILNYLQSEDLKKIPENVLNAIEYNMDNNYEYYMNEDINLEKQEILPETKAILYNLFRDYLCEPWQREKIIKMQAEEWKKIEEQKKQKYNVNIFENKK